MTLQPLQVGVCGGVVICSVIIQNGRYRVHSARRGLAAYVYQIDCAGRCCNDARGRGDSYSPERVSALVRHVPYEGSTNPAGCSLL